MQEGDESVNPSRYRRLLVVCWVPLVFRGGGAEQVVAQSSPWILDYVIVCGFRCWPSGAACHYRD